MAETLGHFAREHCACGTIHILDLHVDLDRLAFFERRRGQFDQLAIQNIVDRVVLALGPVDFVLLGLRLVEDAAEIQPFRLPVVDHRLLFQKLGFTDDLFQPGETHLGQKRAHFFRQIEEEVDDVFRRALETLA